MRSFAPHPAIAAVGELIRSRPEDVTGEDGQRWRVRAPCLLAMLTIYLHASTSGSGGGGNGGGTLPLNTQAWDLLREIKFNTASWAELLGIDRREYRDDGVSRGGAATPGTGRLLRACAVTAASTAREPVADAILRCARRWKGQIEQIVAGQVEQRQIRGVPCPGCGQASILEPRDDGYGGTTRFQVPALVLVRDEDTPTVCCLGCGWSSPLVDLATPGGEVDVVTRDAA